MKRNRLIIATAVALIIIFSSLLFVFQVRKSEMAVVTTFGKASQDVSEPGAYFRWPWPIQQVYILDQRIQNLESGFEEGKLLDQYQILLQVYVGWKIEKPSLFFPRTSNGSMIEAKKLLLEVIRTAQSEVVNKHLFSDFVSADGDKSKFDEIENEILKTVQDQGKLGEYGIDVKFVQIKKIGLPERVTEKVFERMKNERAVLIAKIKGEGDVQSSTIRSKADSEAAALLAQAELEAKEIRSQGEAAAASSLEVLKQNPELAVFIMKLNALEQLLKERTTLVLDPTYSPLDLLNNNYGASRAPNAKP